MNDVFTVGQVAKMCKVAPRTVSKWFDKGRLQGYRIPSSGDRRIPRNHLMTFLKESRMPLGTLEEEPSASTNTAAEEDPRQTVFTTTQVAKICHVAPRTVAKWFDAGWLRGYRIAGSSDRRIPRENLILFLKHHGMPLGSLAEEGAQHPHAVLMIGAEPIFISRFRKLLPEGEHLRYAFASSGFEAGLSMGTSRPDIVVVDFALGRGEALQIVEALRRNPPHAQPTIIALACEDDATPEALGAYGVQDVFKKPLDPALLARRIQSAIGSR